MRFAARPWTAAAWAVAFALAAPASAVATAESCGDPEAAEYATHECKVERLRARSFAVVAVVDSGINPYHVDFRLAGDDDLVGVHPSEYIEGYPAGAHTLRLSFDAVAVGEARARDVEQWAQAGPGELSWVDGTNIVGGVSVDPSVDFFDTGGHGTGVASQAAGRVLGPNHPDVLLVAVKSGDAGVEWASRQPWIDAISMSWSRLVPLGFTAASTWSAADAGKVVCAATGNLTVPLWFFQEQGPSWHVNVGAVHAADRTEPTYTGFPADVLGVTAVPAASHTSMTESRQFSGTSGATPAVCGLIAQTVADARRRLGDTREGSRGDGVLAVGPALAGPAGDGALTRAEVEDAVMATAVPTTSAPPADFVRGGYGIVDRDSVADALAVLVGERARPDRPVEDLWLDATDAARDAVWGAPPPD